MKEPVRYPILEESLLHLSGRTGRIIRWLLEQHVQDAVGGRESWKITINGKGDDLKTVVEVFKVLD